MSNPRMLADWSQEYIDTFYNQTPDHPIIGKFFQREDRDRFVASVRARKAGDPTRLSAVRVEPTKDGLGITVEATPATLLELVEAAREFNGQILFPGVRQASGSPP